MSDYPKDIKKLIRKYSSIAYEEELRQALMSLSKSFDDWKKKDIDSYDLSDRIHEFHDGISRELFKMYNSPMKEIGLCRAIANNVIDRRTIPEILLKALERKIEFYEQEY
jgi:hypothetical protein